MVDSEFINRCTNFFKDEVEKECEKRRNKSSEYYKNNKEYYRKYHSKYSNTEKGKYAHSKRNAKTRYYTSVCENLTWKEKKQIGRFYKNCPSGFEVDHIIPLARGGKHKLSNLQYLTKSENIRKGNRLDWKNTNTYLSSSSLYP